MNVLIDERIERESIATAALYAFVAPAFAAYAHVALIAAYLYLRPFRYYLPARIETCVDNGFSSARAGAFYLIDRIGNLEKTPRTLKKLRPEIGAQSIAYHVATEIIYHSC